MKNNNEERKNKMKVNAALGFVWVCGLFTAHTLTKLYYKQQINDMGDNNDKFELFLRREREKDHELIHELRHKNNLLEMKMRQYERDNKLRKELEDIEKK